MLRRPLHPLALPALLGALAVACGGGGGGSSPTVPGATGPEPVSITRDVYGVPHVFADTDEGAYFGVGYATAQDRLFQMAWHRLLLQGRLAEFLGEGPDGAYLESDRRLRTLGYARHAQRVVEHLDAELLGLLEAYAEGVNAYAAAAPSLSPLFAELGLDFEPWTAADCVGAWIRAARNFTGASREGLTEAKILRDFEDELRKRCGSPASPACFAETVELFTRELVFDEDAAVVQEDELPPDVRQAILDYAESNGVRAGARRPPTAEAPKFSQAWAVAGEQTVDGRAVLVGDPRTRIGVPSVFYEWHAQGATFDVRGMGVPGSPNLLVGSSASVAWSVTALGLDQADLYRLSVDPVGHPGEYELDGVWHPFEVSEVETVRIAGDSDQLLTYRECSWGPVVTELVPEAQPAEEFAVKAIPLCEPERDSSAGYLAMYRASGVEEFGAALEGVRFPSFNIVFADAEGRIGYWANGAAPLRAPAEDAPLAGFMAQDGGTSQTDWREIVPHDVMPWILDPPGGVLVSANHAPVGGWYPLDLRMGSGAAGDSHRSRRLRELLRKPHPLTLQDVEAPHFDTINTGRRDLVLLALHLRDDQSFPFEEEADRALRELDGWVAQGTSMEAVHRATALAAILETKFRDADSPELVEQYGGGTAGLENFVKTRIGELETLGQAQLTTAERTWLDERFAKAWLELTDVQPDPAQWLAGYTEAFLELSVEPWTGLEGLPSIDRDALGGHGQTLDVAGLVCTDAGTLLSQAGQSYTQRVVPGDPDGAVSVLPFGQSEPGGEHATDQLPLFVGLSFKPSPTTPEGIEALGPVTTTVVERPPADRDPGDGGGTESEP